MAHDIDQMLSFEVKKEIADRYFGFRKLIEEDIQDYDNQVLLSFRRLEQKIGFDLVRLYILLKDRELIHEFFQASNLDERLFFDPYLTESETIKQRVFAGRSVHGLTKNSRFYFYDNGVRNAIIKNFNDLRWRDDVGRLWENYLFMERLKKRQYKKIFANQYFWRTWDQKEIDLVEEREGKLFGYEFKWNLKKKIKAPSVWLKTYPNAQWQVISRENYLDFIS